MANHEEYYDTWIDLYKSGKNTYEIASIYKCNRNKVGKVIKDAGITRSKSEAAQV